MRLNILIGGKAGQGINKVSGIVSKILINQGYFTFNYKDYPSIIRGGHNFNVLSISDKDISSHESKIDIMIALDELTKQIHENELKKKVKLFIQVNLANENQKSGILINDLDKFYYYCTKELLLNVIGLMCLPPHDSNSQKYFSILRNSAEKLKLKDLSMGMSSDFEDATFNGSTFLRLGSKIMGKRNSI